MLNEFMFAWTGWASLPYPRRPWGVHTSLESLEGTLADLLLDAITIFKMIIDRSSYTSMK